MMIIKIEAERSGQHMFQSQSHRTECWLDGYIAVPQELENEVIKCNGYCDLVVENGNLKSIVAHPDLIPKEETELTPTEVEQLRATDEEYNLIIDNDANQ